MYNEIIHSGTQYRQDPHFLCANLAQPDRCELSICLQTEKTSADPRTPGTFSPEIRFFDSLVGHL